MIMTSRKRSLSRREDGVALIYMAVTLTALLLFSGLAIDGGRGYVVKAQLTKAVDGAALAAARALNSGDPKGEAQRIFKQNFPPGFMGTSTVTDPTSDPNFYKLATNVASGINVITITASADMPTSFMKLGNFDKLTVNAMGEATRRMVDLSLVVDVSGSIGSQWATVRDATRDFINSFDAAHDRLALTLFSTGSQVLDTMPPGRGFDKTKLKADVPDTLPNGSTLMAEGLYRAWDQLRTVANGQQSGLRIVVLFTDGASNGVPGKWDSGSAIATAVRTYDFPNRHDPDGQTWDNPQIVGVTATSTVSGSPNSANSFSVTADATTQSAMKNTSVTGGMNVAYKYMPANSWHTQHSSSGIPTSFPFVSNTLTVNGTAQSTARSLIPDGTGKNPTTLWNVNNAARNLLEIIADAARTDAGGDYPIRIYTIGMGNLAPLLLGTMPETPASILQRIANDPDSPDHNPNQLDGAYFYAPTAADVSAAYQGIQNQILRLSK
jgi:Flp pilus assembly protein TadG